MKIIRTPRLIIKSLCVDDISKKYIEWLNDKEVNQYLETRFQVQDNQSCWEFVKKIQEDANEELFAIYTKNNNEHIGNCKLGVINKFHHTAEISFFIGNKSLWGGGYATEVVSHLVRYGFDNLGLEKIMAGCYESNKGSKKVLIKAGFKVEGFCKEQVVLDNHREGLYKLGILKNECY